MDSIQLKNYYSIPSSYEVHKRKKKSKNKDGIDPSLLNRGKKVIKCTTFLRLRIFHYKSVETEKDRN